MQLYLFIGNLAEVPLFRIGEVPIHVILVSTVTASKKKKSKPLISLIIAAFVIPYLLTHDACSAKGAYGKLICGSRYKS